jgi:coenzyme F420-reducing hydrogenase delta subunit
VGNRAAERALACRTLQIYVDPLFVARAFREGVDAVLIDGDPIRHAQLVANELVKRCYAISQDVHRVASSISPVR